MKLAIYGLGIVGGSLERYLAARDHEIVGIDPFKGREGSTHGCSAIFICVPVPTKGFKQDLSIVETILQMNSTFAGPIFLRSTVLPGTTDMLAKKYRANLIAFPEFLTERQADYDMRWLPLIYGRPGERIISRLFDTHHQLPMKNSECEMVKYAHNCFGALKVTYFNGIYEHCERLGLDYDKVVAGVTASGHINKPHTQVPGPDGRFGYGGKCFPKDMEAFVGFLKSDILGKFLMDAHCMNRFYRGEKSADKRPIGEVDLEHARSQQE